MLPAGTQIANRFVIERQAGEGGMSTVYRARDTRTGKPVAIKVLGEQTLGQGGNGVDLHRIWGHNKTQ